MGTNKSTIFLNSRKFIYLAGILLITFFTICIYSYTLSGEKDYTIYKTRIFFKDYTVAVNGKPYRLDGEIDGLLFVSYSFRDDHVIVETYYKSYDIKGFTDNVARQYIERLLNARNTHIYNRYEPPYPASESFVLKGGLKYYVSPYYLGLFPVYRQDIAFLMLGNGSRTMIKEHRFFRYTYGGRLIQSVINATIDSNGAIQQYYFELAPVSSNDASTILFTEENLVYMSLAGIIISFIILFFNWPRCR